MMYIHRQRNTIREYKKPATIDYYRLISKDLFNETDKTTRRECM